MGDQTKQDNAVSKSRTNDGLCLQLLKEMKAETREHLEDYVHSEDLGCEASDVVVKLDNFFIDKIQAMMRKA